MQRGCGARFAVTCRTVSPTAVPPVPGEQQVGEPVIAKAREQQRHPVAEQRRQSPLPRRHPPQRNRDIRADDQAALLIGGMQAAPDIVDGHAITRQRVGLLVDVPEREGARANGGEQLVALPVDAGVADGAAGVVVDGEVGGRYGQIVITTVKPAVFSERCLRQWPISNRGTNAIPKLH